MPLIKGEGHPANPDQAEGKSRTGLLKKGTVSYEPAPITTRDLRSGADKAVQVFKEADPRASQLAPGAEIEKMKEEAEKTVSRAKDEAERTLAEAQTKAKKLIEQTKLYGLTAHDHSKREGFEEGKKEGHLAGFSEFQNLMESARDLLAQIAAERERIAKSAEKNLALLAVKIAARVIGAEVQANETVVINMVRASLERVKERDHVVIRVHPDDLERVNSRKETFRQWVPGISAMEIQPDPRVDQGSCVVETDLGTVDARISTQLAAIEAAFSKYEPPEGTPTDQPPARNSTGTPTDRPPATNSTGTPTDRPPANENERA